MDSSFLPHTYFRKLWIPTVFNALNQLPSLRIPIQISRPLRLALLRVLLSTRVGQLGLRLSFWARFCSARLPEGQARINQIFCCKAADFGTKSRLRRGMRLARVRGGVPSVLMRPENRRSYQ